MFYVSCFNSATLQFLGGGDKPEKVPFLPNIFTAWRYVSAVGLYAVVVCLSIRPSVRHKPVLY